MRQYREGLIRGQEKMSYSLENPEIKARQLKELKTELEELQKSEKKKE